MDDDQFKQQVLEQFAAINGRLDKIDAHLTEHDNRFDELQRDIGQVYEGVQAILDQQEIEIKERAHINIVLNRHERWITGLAKQSNLKLSHD